MKLQIDPDALTLDEARKLARHWGELTDAITDSNNALIVALNTIFADEKAEMRPTLIKARLALNTWSEVLNGVTEASNAEVRRILGIESSPSTLQ
jgi:hypothetical protein